MAGTQRVFPRTKLTLAEAKKCMRNRVTFGIRALRVLHAVDIASYFNTKMFITILHSSKSENARSDYAWCCGCLCPSTYLPPFITISVRDGYVLRWFQRARGSSIPKFIPSMNKIFKPMIGSHTCGALIQVKTHISEIGIPICLVASRLNSSTAKSLESQRNSTSRY